MGIPYAEVIGDPIAHSKSPLIHKFWLEKVGVKADYRACQVLESELAGYFARRRGDAEWRGCNVTMPHKMALGRILGNFDADTVDLEPINCVVPVEGELHVYNFDELALRETVPLARTHRPIVIIGGGGAAWSVVRAIGSRVDLRLVVRDLMKARSLLAGLTVFDLKVYDFEEAERAMSGCLGLINATPLGMSGQPPMSKTILGGLSKLRRGAFVYDMVYHPLETELLGLAKMLNLVPIDGLSMLIEQAACSFAQFFGRTPPRECDHELRELLTK